MKKKAPSQPQIIAAIALLLFIASQSTTSCAQRFVSPAHDLVRSFTAPVAGPLESLGSSLRSNSDNNIDLGSHAQLERNLLEQQVYNEQLRQHLESLTTKMNQLAAVRKYRGLRDVTLLDADVTWAEGADGRALRISVGTRDGVADGQVVTDGINLVGRITGVESGYAVVRPITRRPSHLAARLRTPTAAPDVRGAIVQVTLDDQGRRFLGRADAADQVQVGDVAHLDDHKWPAIAQGFLIGKVVAVEKDENDPLLRRIVVVEPIRHIANLRSVVVLLDGQTGTERR